MRLDFAVSTDAPLWRSAFRPFYLFGTAYAVVVMLIASVGYIGLIPAMFAHPLRWWHGHEMAFGFATAMIVGTLLTALPSWAETPEIKGPRLALLTALWLVGRVAIACAPVVPGWIVAAADLALIVALSVMLAPQIVALDDRRYLVLFVVLAGLFGSNLLYHVGIAAPESGLAERGLRMAVDSIALMFVLKAGVLTPVFTRNALLERGSAAQVVPSAALDWLAVGTVLLTAALEAAGAGREVVGLGALAAFAANAARLVRWRGVHVIFVPLVFVMHVAYGWFVLALGLRGIAPFWPEVPPGAWLHAFTIGAIGTMSVGLMVRVVLRHTGREPTVPRVALLAWAAMFVAAVLRVAANWAGAPTAWAAGSALAWSLAFALCLAHFAAMLVNPSLPRSADATPRDLSEGRRNE